MYHPKGIRNHNTMNDPKLTEMIEKQVVTLDKADRKKQIDEIQRYLAVKQYFTFGTVGFVYSVTQPWVKKAYYTNDYGNVPQLAAQVWLDNKPK